MAEIRSKIDGDETHGRKVSSAKRLIADFSNLYETATYEQKRGLVEAIADSLGGATLSKVSGLRFGCPQFESDRAKYLTRRPKKSEVRIG
jgi:hypothetical protein